MTVYGDGEQSRDFTYVDNVVEANLLAAEAGRGSGGVVNVACGKRVTVNALIGQLREITGRDVPVEFAPPRPGEVRHSEADITLAKQALGYAPAVSFGEGLRRTVAFYESLESSRVQAILQETQNGAR